MNIQRLITGGVAAATAAAAFVVPAAAADSAAAPRPRLERACQRIPNLELRTSRLIARLEGDETVRGSLAWLQRQIDRATSGGRTQLAGVLANRLTVRTTTLELLHQRLDAFPDLRLFCADHGVTL